MQFAGETLSIGTYETEELAKTAYSDFIDKVGDTKDGLNAVIEKAVQMKDDKGTMVRNILFDAVECMNKVCTDP